MLQLGEPFHLLLELPGIAHPHGLLNLLLGHVLLAGVRKPDLLTDLLDLLSQAVPAVVELLL